MARPVYSVQLFSLAPALPSNTIVVPAGVKIVVRDLDVYEESFVVGGTLVFENAAGGILWLAERTTTALAVTWSWRGRQVFNPGESITIRVDSGTWTAQMSGYELTLV